VVVFATSLANNTWIASIPALGDIHGYLAVQVAEDGGAACVVQASKFLVGEDSLGHFDGIARYELDHTWWETGFEEDAVDDVVRGYG